jgi:hypothetical protein
MMNKLKVPKKDFFKVKEEIKEKRIKHHPFRKFKDCYHVEIIPHDDPIVSYLILKYDISIV